MKTWGLMLLYRQVKQIESLKWQTYYSDPDAEWPRQFWVDCVVPQSAANSNQLKLNVAKLHRQPDHRTGSCRVMKSLFCLSPRGRDLWANLGLSPQILGIPSPPHPLGAVNGDRGLKPPCHRSSHSSQRWRPSSQSHIRRRKNNADSHNVVILLHTQLHAEQYAYTFTEANAK